METAEIYGGINDCGSETSVPLNTMQAPNVEPDSVPPYVKLKWAYPGVYSGVYVGICHVPTSGVF